MMPLVYARTSLLLSRFLLDLSFRTCSLAPTDEGVNRRASQQVAGSAPRMAEVVPDLESPNVR